jgi:trk system potassium uptake protein TrkH
MNFNRFFVLYVLGLMLLVESTFMLLSGMVALYYGEYDFIFHIISASISAVLGAFLAWVNRNVPRDVGKREGYVVVASVWVVFSLFGSLPFYLSGAIPSFTDSFFETMSGFSTTGGTILNDIEALPHGLLFWRSLTQWLGGMGIIVFSMTILPILGLGATQLYVAEMPGPMPDKLHPRIHETAKRLWAIYVGFTIVQAIMLITGGMPVFDAVCHSLTTMATGGYSTKQNSMAHFDSPYLQYTMIVFMFIGGMNFAVSYQILRGKFNKVKNNEELRFYLLSALGIGLLIGVILFFSNVNPGLEPSIRHGLFQTISIMTTTGYYTADYQQWFPFLGVILFMLMFMGASAGSTSGGISIARVVLLLKNSVNELKRLSHPNAIIPLRFNGKSVSQSIITNVLAFIVIYMLLVGICTIIMSAMGYDLNTSLGAVVASIGNVGPGTGEFGPTGTYASLPDIGKWFLALLMLMGRLELFTVILIFTPSFWRQ